MRLSGIAALLLMSGTAEVAHATGGDGVVSPTAIVQSASSIDFANPANPVVGGGVLYRTPKGVDISGAFADLDRNSAYSTWWFIFNQPAKCTGACDEDDLIAGVGQVFYAGGFVADSSGKANPAFSLGRGGIPTGAARFSSVLPILNPASEVGLHNPLGAQIGMVIRNHGPLVAGGTGEQIGSYFGGCAGHGGSFACFDEQIVIFPAP